MSTARTATMELTVSALFIFIGQQPRTAWLDGIVARDDRGFVLTGPDRRARAGGWNLDRDPFLLESSLPGRLRGRRRAARVGQAHRQRRRRGRHGGAARAPVPGRAVTHEHSRRRKSPRGCARRRSSPASTDEPLERLVELGEIVDLGAGRGAHSRGRPGRRAVRRARRRARGHASGRARAEIPLALVGPGSLQGEIAALEGGRRLASVRATGAAEVLRIPVGAIRELLAAGPGRGAGRHPHRRGPAAAAWSPRCASARSSPRSARWPPGWRTSSTTRPRPPCARSMRSGRRSRPPSRCRTRCRSAAPAGGDAAAAQRARARRPDRRAGAGRRRRGGGQRARGRRAGPPEALRGQPPEAIALAGRRRERSTRAARRAGDGARPDRRDRDRGEGPHLPRPGAGPARRRPHRSASRRWSSSATGCVTIEVAGRARRRPARDRGATARS